MHEYQHIVVSRPDDSPGVAVVSLNRPRKRNAINSTMWKEIGHVFSEVTYSSDDIRCIALVGSGSAFCAGIDLSDPSFGLIDDNEENGNGNGNGNGSISTCNDVARKAFRFRPQILEMQRAFTALEACPVPVVAIIQGFCIGGGVDLITAADVRICSPDALFSVREARLGLAADVGTLQRLPKIVGHSSRVRELVFTGEDFGSAEAARIGLVSRISTSNESLVYERAWTLPDASPPTLPLQFVEANCLHLGKFVPVWPARSALSFWSRIFEIAHLVNKMADFRQTKTDRAALVTKYFGTAATFGQMPFFPTENEFFQVQRKNSVRKHSHE